LSSCALNSANKGVKTKPILISTLSNKDTESLRESTTLTRKKKEKEKREFNVVSFSEVQKEEKEQELVLLKGTKYETLQVIFSLLGKEKLRKKVQINVENISLKDLIDLTFKDILKVNYKIIPSKRVIPNVPIDLSLYQEFPLKKFLEIVFNIFEINGVIVDYNKKENLFVIKKVPNLVGKLPVIVGKSIPPHYSKDDLITLIYPLNTGALSDNYDSFTKFFVPPGVSFSFSYGKKYLILSGPVRSIRPILKIVKFFDRPVFSEKKLLIFNVNNVKPSKFISKLKTILAGFNIPIVESPKDNGIFFLPLDSNSKIVAIVPDESYISIIKKLVKELDKTESSADKGLLFFEPQNRSAESIYSVMRNFKKFFEETSKKKIFVLLDKTRNQLIIRAPKEEIPLIEEFLKKLDKAPKQVLVEVTIAEITLKDQLEYGLEWYLKHSGYWQGSLSNVLGLGANGFTYSLVTSTNKFRMIINAFAKKNLINILSSPHLVVLSGKQASITVGTEVPVISSEVSASDVHTTQGPNILRNIVYKSTGVQLSIEPIVSSKGMVELVISQSVSEAQTNNISSIDSPLILNRSITTDVFVKSGQTVILGGLISETKSKSKNEVPVLGDMPLLGNLFSSSSSSRVKTELIVMITPYILNEATSYQKISQEIIKKLSKSLKLENRNVNRENSETLSR